MTYHDQLIAVSSQSEQQAIDQYDGLDEPTALAAIPATIAKANTRAANLALLAFSVAAMGAMRQSVATPMLSLPNPIERLRKATVTAFSTAADSPDPKAIIGRLARCEPLAAAQNTTSDILADDESVRGWVRAVNPGCCELCLWWAAGGKVFPADTEFRYHPGCSCIQVPVFGTGRSGSVLLDRRGLGRSKVYDNPNASKISPEDEAAWAAFEKSLLTKGH